MMLSRPRVPRPLVGQGKGRVNLGREEGREGRSAAKMLSGMNALVTIYSSMKIIHPLMHIY